MSYKPKQRISEAMKQKIVMALDVMGWEQDGAGLRFIGHGKGEDSVREFKTWPEACDFANEEARKHLANRAKMEVP